MPNLALRLIPALGIVFAGALAAQTPASPRHADVEGDVVSSVDGKPIEGARVKLESGALRGEARYAKADAEGHFQFPNVAFGTYKLSAEGRGCSPGSTSVRLLSSDRPAVKIALTPYGVIRGRLTDPNGAAFPYTFVTVMTPRPIPAGKATPMMAYPLPGGQSQLVRVDSAFPDDRGEFSVIVQPGTYYLLAGDNADRATWDPTYRNTFYPHTSELAAAKAILVAPGAHVRADIEIVQLTGARLTGQIVHPPLPAPETGVRFSTSVVLRPEHDVTNTGPTGSATGVDRYELQNVPPGKYTLLAVVSEHHDGSGERAKPIFGIQRHVEIGTRDTSADVELAALPEISGAVTFAEGCTPMPLRLSILNWPWGDAPDTITGSNGEFVIAPKFPGIVQWFRVSPVSGGDPPPVLRSARLGDRDILQDGFEYPPAQEAPLRLTVSCAATRRLP